MTSELEPRTVAASRGHDALPASVETGRLVRVERARAPECVAARERAVAHVRVGDSVRAVRVRPEWEPPKTSAQKRSRQEEQENENEESGTARDSVHAWHLERRWTATAASELTGSLGDGGGGGKADPLFGEAPLVGAGA